MEQQLIAAKQMSDMNGDDLQIPSLSAPLVSPQLFHFYLASNDCTTKSAKSTRRQTQRDYSNRYSNCHQIELEMNKKTYK